MKIQKSQITIDGLLEAISRGKEAVQEAGEIMAALADGDARIYEKIMEQHPNIPLHLLVTLEKVGRGVIYFELLFDSSPGARRLLAMPYSQQKKYYEQPIKIVEIRDGKKVEIEMPIHQLSSKQVNIAFSATDYREPKEQAKIVQAPIIRRVEPAQRYEILDDGTFIVHFSETSFSPSQLQDIYERVKEKAVRSLKK
jgi:hypothetical protein